MVLVGLHGRPTRGAAGPVGPFLAVLGMITARDRAGRCLSNLGSEAGDHCVEHRGLRQAAEALNIRQSALSRRLRDMETRLGAQLFERTNGGTRPTIAAREFLASARRILAETDVALRRLKTRSRGEDGLLTEASLRRFRPAICSPHYWTTSPPFVVSRCILSMSLTGNSPAPQRRPEVGNKSPESPV
jgi:hypothetical protein